MESQHGAPALDSRRARREAEQGSRRRRPQAQVSSQHRWVPRVAVLGTLAAATIAVKSMQHFRAAFGPIARRIVEVDTGALCTRDFLSRPYRAVRRPLYPLDPVEACEHALPRA